MIEDESERFNINKINGFDAVIFHELGHVLDQYIIVKNTDDPYFLRLCHNKWLILTRNSV